MNKLDNIKKIIVKKPLKLDCGVTISDYPLAYETYGKLNQNKDNAIMLLEFLSEEMSQNLYGKINFEYPVNPSVEPSKELSGWGIPIEDKISIIKIAELGPLAQKIIDRVSW